MCGRDGFTADEKPFAVVEPCVLPVDLQHVFPIAVLGYSTIESCLSACDGAGELSEKTIINHFD